MYIDKNLVFYTNCQGGIGIKKVLETKFSFKSIRYIETFSLIWNKKDIPTKILNEADIFIYQPLDEKYGKYSTQNIENNILSYLKENCIKISFPYIYFACLFPLFYANQAAEIDGGSSYDNNKIVNKDVIINLKKIYNNDEVLKLYDDMKIDFEFEKNYFETINRIRNKEKYCTIKITHLFSLENLKKKKLMNTNNHPTNFVLEYISNEILEVLNLPKQIFDIGNDILSSQIAYSIYSYNFYKFEWLDITDCNEDLYKNFIRKI